MPLADPEVTAGTGLLSQHFHSAVSKDLWDLSGGPTGLAGRIPRVFSSCRIISLLKAPGHPPGLFLFIASQGRWGLTPLSSVVSNPFNNFLCDTLVYLFLQSANEAHSRPPWLRR